LKAIPFIIVTKIKYLGINLTKSGIYHKNKKPCLEHTPIVLATWKAKIRTLTVKRQPRQNISETPSQPISWVVLMYSPRYVGSIRRIATQAGPGINVRS
jgi:hypothetical protein